MRIDQTTDGEQKKRWKVVRRDTFADVDGEVVSADEDTGECVVSVAGETRSHSFGVGGIRIVGRRR